MRLMPRVNFIAAGLALPIALAACKVRQPSSGLESAPVNASSRPLPTNLVFQEAILAPIDDNSQNAPSETDARTRLKSVGVSLDAAGAQISSKALMNGERVFFLKEEQQTTPIASVQGTATYQWSQITNASLQNNSVDYAMTNIFVRHPFNQEPAFGMDPNYFVYTIDNEPVVIRMTDHLMMNDHFEFRSGNTFYSETKKRLFEFQALESSTWRVKGNIDNGYICDGSVVWHDTDQSTFYSATKQYGTTQVYKWTLSAGLLHFKESVQNPSQYLSKINAAQSCPGRDEVSVSTALAKQTYYVSKNVASSITTAVPIEKLQSFPAGTRVSIDGTIYATLFATSKEDIEVMGDAIITVQNPEVYVTNTSRTVAADNGKTMGRVYKWYQGKLTEIGTTDSYLVSLANQGHKLSLDRITATNAGIKSSDSARWQLALAEQKAATVDTAGKLAVSFITFAVCDAAYNAAEAPAKKVLGMAAQSGLGAGKNALQSISKIDLFGTATASTRLAAALFLTGMQGLAIIKYEVELNNGPERNTAEQLLARSLNGAPTLGLRGLFPAQAGSYLSSVSSGLTLRWGPVSAQQKAAYDQNDNLNKLATMSPTKATQISSTYATVFGVTKSALNFAGPVGVLIADVISGQATPSRVVGGAIEIATVFLVEDPRIRPFAAILAKQTNAMLQLTEARVRTSMAGKKLDDALAVIQLQRAARDALLWLSVQAPDQVSKLNPVEQAYIVATVEDPYLLLRAYYAPEKM